MMAHELAAEPGEIAVAQGQVAGMIGTSILLLVGALMLLIADDEARPRPWQEQRRPCTHANAGLARGDRPPHPLALPRPDARMPLRRLGAEAVLDPSEELRSERDLGQQEQH